MEALMVVFTASRQRELHIWFHVRMDQTPQMDLNPPRDQLHPLVAVHLQEVDQPPLLAPVHPLGAVHLQEMEQKALMEPLHPLEAVLLQEEVIVTPSTPENPKMG